jgi:hypothetical protein
MQFCFVSGLFSSRPCFFVIDSLVDVMHLPIPLLMFDFLHSLAIVVQYRHGHKRNTHHHCHHHPHWHRGRQSNYELLLLLLLLHHLVRLQSWNRRIGCEVERCTKQLSKDRPWIVHCTHYHESDQIRGMTNRTKLTLNIHVTTLASPLESPSFTGYDHLVTATFAHRNGASHKPTSNYQNNNNKQYFPSTPSNAKSAIATATIKYFLLEPSIPLLQCP